MALPPEQDFGVEVDVVYSASTQACLDVDSGLPIIAPFCGRPFPAAGVMTYVDPHPFIVF
jgi:hypothetical protein